MGIGRVLIVGEEGTDPTILTVCAIRGNGISCSIRVKYSALYTDR